MPLQTDERKALSKKRLKDVYAPEGAEEEEEEGESDGEMEVEEEEVSRVLLCLHESMDLYLIITQRVNGRVDE
jgi:hypothetical protein